MALSLRNRILLTVVPLVVLLAALGSVGLWLLYRTGGRIDAILKENYESVKAMFRLNEALERIDSSFQFALAGREAEARKQYDSEWGNFEKQVHIEENNVTILPLEQELVDRLRSLKDDYRAAGGRFYAHPPGSPERSDDYFGRPGTTSLLSRFGEIKKVSGEILRINQENMEDASRQAKSTARITLAGFGIGLAALVLLSAGVAWQLMRSILRPIGEVTRAAQAIGSGRLEARVPVIGGDELGQLGSAFNGMSAQLREYRQSDTARLVRARKTAQATIDSFPDPVLVIDPEGRVELANPAAGELLGVGAPRDGQPSPVWQPPEALRGPLGEALHAQRASLTASFDQAVTFRLNGEDRAYLPQVRPIRDPAGDTLGAAVVLNDVTKFRLLDQYKSDLVATVSHELKTPLTSVRLAVHVLLEEKVGSLTPKQAELLVDARDNAERLLRQIEQLLALARLQQAEGGVPFRPEDPLALLRHAADVVRSRADDKHVELVVEGDAPLPAVAIEPERIQLALGNLFENAVTYTPTGGKITATASATPNGQVTLTVADTGIGIPAEYLPHVFERFFRVPGQSEGTGTGLGLAIVKEIVTAHHGEISCESAPGKGTVFRIALPVWTAAADGSAHEH
jgi:two-component system, NtrC family, sensor histidine kinase KinB